MLINDLHKYLKQYVSIPTREVSALEVCLDQRVKESIVILNDRAIGATMHASDSQPLQKIQKP